MNKFLTKITGASLAIAMMIGVGIGANVNKPATEADATGKTDWLSNEVTSGLNASDKYVFATSNTNSTSGKYFNGSTISGPHWGATSFGDSSPASDSAAGVIQLESVDEDIWKIKLVSTDTYVTATKAGSKGSSVTATSDDYGWYFYYTSNVGWNAVYQQAFSSKYASFRDYQNGSFRSYTAASITSASSDGSAFKIYKYQPQSQPTISLSTTSVEGFTGQEYSINAAFANLTSNFAWGTPSGTGTISGAVTASSGTGTDGSSTYSGTLTGAGSVTLTTSGGGVNNAPSVSFSITQTTLSLNKDNTSIYQGRSETLVATHNAQAVGGVNWTSDNEKVTVADGVVSVALDATVGDTATITATSAVDSNVSATCTVTIEKAPQEVLYSVTSKTTVSASGLIPEGTTATFAQTYSTLSQATSGNSFTLTVSGFAKKTVITGITLHMHSNTGASSSYGKLYYSADEGANAYLIGSSDTGVQFNKWGNNTTLTSTYKDVIISDNLSIVVNSSFKLVIQCTNNSLYCDGYAIRYGSDAKTIVEKTFNTQTSLAYHYSGNAQDGFEYSDISIRFGGAIDKDLWNELDTNEHNITGFGVMIADGELIKNSSDFADALAIGDFTPSTVSETFNKDVYAIDFFIPIANMASTIGEDENNYFWNLRWSIDSAIMDEMYSAVAYIKVGDEYVFMNMARESVETMATKYVASGNYSGAVADSLQYIVDHAQQA